MFKRFCSFFQNHPLACHFLKDKVLICMGCFEPMKYSRHVGRNTLNSSWIILPGSFRVNSRLFSFLNLFFYERNERICTPSQHFNNKKEQIYRDIHNQWSFNDDIKLFQFYYLKFNSRSKILFWYHPVTF